MATLEAYNQALFLMIDATPATPAWLIKAALICAQDLIYLIPLMLAMMWLSGDDRQRELALRVYAVTLLALGANSIIGLLWPHPRPFMIPLGHTFLRHAADPSFPSDHLTVFWAAMLTLYFGQRRWTAGLLLAGGVAVAWARVFLGVHFPLDMAGAVAVSSIAYAAIVPLWRVSGAGITRSAIALYQTLFARPIGLGWLRR